MRWQKVIFGTLRRFLCNTNAVGWLHVRTEKFNSCLHSLSSLLSQHLCAAASLYLTVNQYRLKHPTNWPSLQACLRGRSGHLPNLHKSYGEKGSPDIKFAHRLISFQRLYGLMLSAITRKSYLSTLQDLLILRNNNNNEFFIALNYKEYSKALYMRSMRR